VDIGRIETRRPNAAEAMLRTLASASVISPIAGTVSKPVYGSRASVSLSEALRRSASNETAARRSPVEAVVCTAGMMSTGGLDHTCVARGSQWGCAMLGNG